MKKFLLAFVMIICMLASGVIIVSADTYGDLEYTILNGEAIITDCVQTARDTLIIPSTIGEYPVKSIAKRAFYNCYYLTSITIEDGITEIGESAFSSCTGLEQIMIPKSVTTIGESAFTSCYNLKVILVDEENQNFSTYEGALLDKEKKNIIRYPMAKTATTFTAPNSVENIANTAFSGCRYLKTVTLPIGVTSIGEGAFFSCEVLESIVIGNTLTYLGDEAFYNCPKLKYMYYYIDTINIKRLINESSGNDILKSIGWVQQSPVVSSGSCGANLTWEMHSGGTLHIKGTGAMSSWDNYSPWNFKPEDVERAIIYKGVTTIGNKAFDGSINLESVIIPEGVITIGELAFNNCYKLTDVVIPDSVTKIETRAFNRCENIEGVTFGKNVTEIGKSAFSGCKKLKSITIPDNITIIDMYTFSNCESLSELTFCSNIKEIGEYAFDKCKSLETIYFPGSESKWKQLNISSVGNNALTTAQVIFVTPIIASGDCGEQLTWGLNSEGEFTISGSGEMYSWNDYTEVPWHKERLSILSATINTGATNISGYAFQGCFNLAEVKLPETITHIGDFSFDMCEKLQEISFPNSLIIVGNKAFGECISLKAIEFGNNVQKIDTDAFGGCTNLKDILLNENLKEIGTGAFVNCTNIKSINIPNSVTTLGDGIFSNCRELNSIYIGAGVNKIGNSIFDSCMKLAEITVDNNNQNFSSLNGNLYNKNQTKIVNYALGKTDECFSIPLQVTTIGKSAFASCSNIKNITISEGVKVIEDFAFSWCKNLEEISLSDSIESIGFSAFNACSKLVSASYYGNEEQWMKVTVGKYNDNLINCIKFTYPYTETHLSQDGTTYTVNVVNIENGKTVILALYDGERFVEMQSAVYTGEAVPFTTTKTYTKAKVMVWNDLTNLKPVCNIEIIE